MKMLRITFFAAAALICSTQAYAVMYLARPYEPNVARWLTRDPIGERGGPNLYCFVYNSAVNAFDPLGLCLCRCKSVKGGPFSDHIVHRGKTKDHGPGLTVQVPFDIEFEEGSDISKCHCRGIDHGSLWVSAHFSTGESYETNVFWPNVAHELDCMKRYDDFPGFYFYLGIPDFTYALRYNMSVTYECEDEDRSRKVSDTVGVNALFMGTYPPVWAF